MRWGLALQARAQAVGSLDQAWGLAYQAYERLALFLYIYIYFCFKKNALFVYTFPNKFLIYVLIKL
jgi:hypothetical protein